MIPPLLFILFLLSLSIPWQKATPSACLYQTGALLVAAIPAGVFLIGASAPILFSPGHLPLLLLLLTSLVGGVILLRHGALHLRLFSAGLASGPLPFLIHLAVTGPAWVYLEQGRFPGALLLVVFLPLLGFHLQGPLFSFLLAARPDPELAQRIQPLFVQRGLVSPLVLVSGFPVSAPNAWLLGLNIPRPRLVFGPGLREQLTDDDLTALALHEAGHMKNGDNQRAWVRNIFFSLANSVILGLFFLLPHMPEIILLPAILFIPFGSALILGRQFSSGNQGNREVLADQTVLAAGLARPLRRTLRFLWQVPEDVADDDLQLPQECRERLQAITQAISSLET